MKTYKFTMSSGYVGSDTEEYFEFDDDVTDNEVRDAWVDWVWNYIDGAYIEV